MMAFNGCEVKHLATSASYHGVNYRIYRALSLLTTSAVSAHVLTVTPQEVRSEGVPSTGRVQKQLL